jgi:hypothetical protein
MVNAAAIVTGASQASGEQLRFVWHATLQPSHWLRATSP